MFDVDKIKHYYNVLDLLKEFNIYIHLGSRLDDLELTEVELNRLYRAKLIDKKIYVRAMTIVEGEVRKEKGNE
ncbi:YqgQ family protein [Xylocopilactobacillus apis]|uniref:DUF910 domain-containing protein n=1 Tax=Xylocopilactobacillus apis TaxID=2932183 RepID=A0AAU9D201_9LACO|nr:YqgQ family protein [Xylocopilactobacillus apis]BDR56315.1 hypothetical protein KIMC2_08770 [Xylocopilactobacillus apis]